MVYNTILKYRMYHYFHSHSSLHEVCNNNIKWEWRISPGCLRSHRGVRLCRLLHWRWPFVCKLAMRPPSHCPYSDGWISKNWDEQQVTERMATNIFTSNWNFFQFHTYNTCKCCLVNRGPRYITLFKSAMKITTMKKKYMTKVLGRS